ILSLWEQGCRSGFPQEWKALGYQSLKRSDCARSNGVGGPLKLRGEILDSLRMHADRGAGDALRLAQEGGFLCIAVNEMDERARLVGESAGNDQAGKSSSRAKIEPNPRVGGEVEKLQRIRDVSRPYPRNCGWCDEVGRALPSQQKLDETVQPLGCFT